MSARNIYTVIRLELEGPLSSSTTTYLFEPRVEVDGGHQEHPVAQRDDSGGNLAARTQSDVSSVVVVFTAVFLHRGGLYAGSLDRTVGHDHGSLLQPVPCL